jgi:hypothetical protein
MFLAIMRDSEIWDLKGVQVGLLPKNKGLTELTS